MRCRTRLTTASLTGFCALLPAVGFLHTFRASAQPVSKPTSSVEAQASFFVDASVASLDAPVPAFSLLTSTQEVWRTRDQAGEYSFVLLCYGQDASLDPVLLLSAPVREALAALADTNIPTVIALPAPASTSLNPLLLHDRYGDARHAFATPLNGISCACVDRAGFVRHLEAIEDARTLTPLNFVSLLKRASQTISPDYAAPLQVGTQAPDFACRDMNGQMRRLSELRGKRHLLLTFFPKCFTSHCTSQLSSLRDYNENLQAAGIEVWAVSVDPADGDKGQRAFAKSLNLPFPLLPDVGRNLSILYGAANSPNQVSARMSVLIDRQGKVRWIDKQVNVKTHGQDVMAKVEELKLNELEQKN